MSLMAQHTKEHLDRFEHIGRPGARIRYHLTDVIIDRYVKISLICYDKLNNSFQEAEYKWRYKRSE